MHYLLENPGKIKLILNSNHPGYLSDTKIGQVEQLAGLLNFEMEKVIPRRIPAYLLEFFGKIRDREIEMIGNILQLITFLNICHLKSVHLSFEIIFGILMDGPDYRERMPSDD